MRYLQVTINDEDACQFQRRQLNYSFTDTAISETLIRWFGLHLVPPVDMNFESVLIKILDNKTLDLKLLSFGIFGYMKF